MATTVIIGEDIGRVSFGPNELPGVFQRMSIDVVLEVDKKKVPGRSGMSKQPLGFNDADVSLQLKLVPADRGADVYEQLEYLRRLFYGTDGKARPQHYPIVNRACRAMGIKQILFEQLRLTDENTTDVLTVELKFSSYEPAVRRKERRVKAQTVKDALNATTALNAVTSAMAIQIAGHGAIASALKSNPGAFLAGGTGAKDGAISGFLFPKEVEPTAVTMVDGGATLRGELVLHVNRRHPHLLIEADGPGDILRVAIPVVDVDQNRQPRSLHDVAHGLRHFAEADQANIREGEAGADE